MIRFLGILAISLTLTCTGCWEFLGGEGPRTGIEVPQSDDDGCNGGYCVTLGPDYACQCADGCCEVDCDAEADGSCAVACEEGVDCAVECEGADDCSVSCPDAASCEVDCGGTTQCSVNCPETGCVVHGCDFPLYCAVSCGDGGIPEPLGDDWVCP